MHTTTGSSSAWALPTTTARGHVTSVLARDPQQPPADENDDQGDERDGQEQDENQKDTTDESTAAGTGADGDGQEDADSDEDGKDQGDEYDGAAPGMAGSSTPLLLRFSLPAPRRQSRSSSAPPSSAPTPKSGSPDTPPCAAGSASTDTPASPARPPVERGDDAAPYGLGTWVSEQRRSFKAGTLKPWRTDLLNEVGMV
ncbi:Helicase associated domain protein [Streptomyces sp. NPDC051657]|uniref:helicase associated domain-containing protein n=1 Tax=unclassified Streptomyces TaxID=2593676 RepID=UPI0034175527